MPPPEMLMWVPVVFWFGQTTPTFSITFLSSGLSDRIMRAT